MSSILGCSSFVSDDDWTLMPSIGVLEHFQKVTDQPTRRVKRSGGQSLVNRGLAVWIRENVLLIMRARPIAEVHANMPGNNSHTTPNGGRAYDSGPSQSVRGGILRWEPPKNKRPLKAHPWQNMNPDQVRFRAIADQRQAV